MQYGAEHFEV